MAHRRLVVAGSSMADLTTQSPGTVTKTDMNNIRSGVGKIITPLKIANVTLTMRDYRKNGSNVQSQWSYLSGTGTCTISPTSTELTAMGTNQMSDGNDVLVAAVCTTVSPNRPADPRLYRHLDALSGEYAAAPRQDARLHRLLSVSPDRRSGL